MKYSYLIIFLMCASSCGPNKKDILISAYESMYHEVALGNYDKIIEHLDQKSIELVEEITDRENQNVDDLIAIGIKYKLKYLCIYFSSWSRYMSEKGSKDDFFKFLTQERISFFDDSHLFAPLEHRCRVGTDNNFVAFYFPRDNSNVMDWSKWTEESENTFKLDLIYSLRLNEKKIKQYFNYKDRVKKELSLEEWLRDIYKGYISNNYTPKAVEELIDIRRKKYQSSMNQE